MQVLEIPYDIGSMFFNFLRNEPVIIALDNLGKIRFFKDRAHPESHDGMVVDDEYPQLRHDAETQV